MHSSVLLFVCLTLPISKFEASENILFKAVVVKKIVFAWIDLKNEKTLCVYAIFSYPLPAKKNKINKTKKAQQNSARHIYICSLVCL